MYVCDFCFAVLIREQHKNELEDMHPKKNYDGFTFMLLRMDGGGICNDKFPQYLGNVFTQQL
jgi:hypothetical protein